MAILLILTDLGYREERMQEVEDMAVSKRQPDGRGNLDKTVNGRFITTSEKKEEVSKWITLRGLTMLKQYYGDMSLVI
ncbi:MAG: hypothetical protein JW763_08640 [candidate division Zixibacteria bacterium]|nr:hypothetical protein [candidate division Zixibacteria bacterium]